MLIQATEEPLLSCPPQSPSDVDSCCVETFGGLLLTTQFWDTYTGLESEGQLLPENTWTLHGLWPDFCNGSFTQYCDLTRQYDPIPSPNTTNGLPNGTFVPPYNGSNIGTFLEPFGKYDLLEYMNNYWIAQNQDNAGFWGHEFSKHATCFSTFNVPCYGPEYRKHEEVVDFFQTAIKYYKRVPTYKWLKEASIVPSNTTQYTYTDIRNVLSAKHGAIPFIGCSGPRYNTTEAGKNSTDNGFTRLTEVWYYEHVSLICIIQIAWLGLTVIRRCTDDHKIQIQSQSTQARHSRRTVPKRMAHFGTTREQRAQSGLPPYHTKAAWGMVT